MLFMSMFCCVLIIEWKFSRSSDLLRPNEPIKGMKQILISSLVFNFLSKESGNCKSQYNLWDFWCLIVNMIFPQDWLKISKSTRWYFCVFETKNSSIWALIVYVLKYIIFMSTFQDIAGDLLNIWNTLNHSTISFNFLINSQFENLLLSWNFPFINQS